MHALALQDEAPMGIPTLVISPNWPSHLGTLVKCLAIEPGCGMKSLGQVIYG